MNRKYWLGSVVVSMGLWAGQSLAGQAQQEQQSVGGYTLEQLKEQCRKNENVEQGWTFSSTFTCKTTNTFWVPIGEKAFDLPTDSSVAIKALIKDGKYQSEWWKVGGAGEMQRGTCPVLEQWAVTADVAVTLNSCAELARITTEAEHCKEKLAPIWAECDAERGQQLQQSPFVEPSQSACTWSRTGMTKSCADEGSVRPMPYSCKIQDPSSSQSADSDSSESSDSSAGEHIITTKLGGSSSSSSSSSSASSSDEGANVVCRKVDDREPVVSSYEWGADFRVVMVDRGFGHQSHQVVLVSSEVQPGGLFHAMGLAQGDVISRINSKRVCTGAFWGKCDLSDFTKQVAKAKAEGWIRIEYKSPKGDWRTVTVNPF